MASESVDVPVAGPDLEKSPFFPEDGCCPVCFEELHAPAQFACCHVVCAVCILRSHKAHQLVDCPVCRAVCAPDRALRMLKAIEKASPDLLLAELGTDKLRSEELAEQYGGVNPGAEEEPELDSSFTTAPFSAAGEPSSSGTLRNFASLGEHIDPVAAQSLLLDALAKVDSHDMQELNEALLIIRKALSVREFL
jgi:hypothetical protein